MALWGNNDAASNSTIFAASYVKLTPNTANRDALYGNTTANAYIAGQTIGQYGVDANEITAGGGKVAHTGWVLRKEGQGGRAGRVEYEVLVAGGIVGDGADDAVFPDYTLFFTTQPVNSEEEADSEVSFTVVAGSTPAGATIAYQWYESANGNVFVPAAAGTTGNTTATLTIANNSTVEGYFYKVEISATGAANVESEVATVTIVTP